MDVQIDASNIEHAVSEVRKLMSLKAEANALIAAAHKDLAATRVKLDNFYPEGSSPEQAKTAKEIWRLTVEAHDLSVIAFEGDIAMYDEQIDAIVKAVPLARLDN